MHRDRQFARYGNGGPFEADPLAQLEAPFAQGAVGRAARQNDLCRLVEKPSQMAVAASGYMAVKVRLISPQFVTPYVKSNKNDRNDAEAICEAVGRPSMRFAAEVA